MSLNHPLKSQQGNMLLISIVLVALVSSLILLNLSTSKNLTSQMFYQSDAVERGKILNSTVSFLNDQPVCEFLFPQGFNTAEGAVPVNSETLRQIPGRSGERIDAALKNFSDFELKSIQLSNPVIFPGSDGVQYKQFQASFTVGPKADASDNSKKMERVFGFRNAGVSVNKDENLFLVVGSNNRCYFHRNLADPTASGLDAIPQTCRALGGQYDKSQCNLREFKVDAATGILKTKPTSQAGDNIDTRKSNLADAFCQMEFKALQKLGPHLMDQTGKRSYGWTSLCEKPQWAGCRENNNPDSNKLYSPGYLTDSHQIWSGKKGDLGKAIREAAQVTVDRRASRALPYATASGAWNSTNPNFKSTNSNILGLANIFGGTAAFALLEGNATDLVNIFAMNLVWGPVIGGLLVAFGPKCDGAELYSENRCVQGYFETERMSYRVEKVKYTWKGPRCEWKGKQAIEPVIDEDGIVQMAMKQGQKPPQQLDLSSNEGISPEDLRELAQELNSAKSLPELFTLVEGFSGNSTNPSPMPPELMALVKTREQQLLAELQTRVDQAVNTNNLNELKTLKDVVALVDSRSQTTHYPRSISMQVQLNSMGLNLDKSIQMAHLHPYQGGN